MLLLFQPVIRPRKPVFRDGKWRTKSVAGSSVSYNSVCPSYQHGCNTKNRDVEAAINIALAGTSRITTGFTLPPFERSTSHLNTGTHPHRITKPPVTGAPQVLTVLWDYLESKRRSPLRFSHKPFYSLVAYHLCYLYPLKLIISCCILWSSFAANSMVLCRKLLY
jgi:hypothetical protein